MSLLSCPACLNLFPSAGANSETLVTCPGCGELFSPADDAVAEKTVWFAMHGAHKYGPLILARLEQLVALGVVARADLITRLGAATWLAAGAVGHFFPEGAPASLPAPVEDEPGGADFARATVQESHACHGIAVHADPILNLVDFQVLKKLGAGTMGAVYLAHQGSHDRLVALKVLAKHLAAQQSYVDRFYREAGLLARLRHPGLVVFHGIGEEKSIPYFAMEFVEGISAARALRHRGGTFAVPDALHIVLRCAEALRYAHGLRIIHRDIKPENIMITRLGRLKITDLGLAKPLDEDLSLTASGIGLGTPHYMAPEQARSAKYADQRSDLYALGGVLYHFLTGRVPWQGDNIMDLQREKEHGLFPPARRQNPAVPPALDLILNKMLAKNPERRYPDCAALIGDLTALGLVGEYLSFNPLRIMNAPPLLAERREPVGVSPLPNPTPTIAEHASSTPSP